MTIETDELAAKQAAQQEEFEQLKERARTEELARVKAEGELEGLRRFAEAARQGQTAPQTTLSEDQWIKAETELGMSRQAILANANVMQQIAQAQIAPLREEVENARARAERAEEKLSRMDREREYSGATDDYLKDKPNLGRYKKDINDFVSRFPEADRSDPKKMKELLGMAETYVKGKVGDKMRSGERGDVGSARLGGDEDQDERREARTDEQDFDAAIRNANSVQERRALEDLRQDYENRKQDKELMAEIERSQRSDGLGVEKDYSADFRKGDLIMRKGGTNQRVA